MENLKNNIILLLYTVLVGIISGAIIWTFLKVMNLSIDFFWDYLPGIVDFKYYTITVSLIGGLLIGLFKEKYGDATRELKEVTRKVKKDHRYPYNNIIPSIISAILPLTFGASVGPEAGLAGIIASLCTWASDKLKLFNKELEDLTAIGVSATLGVIFVSPLFAFVEPLENEEDVKLPKTSKNILYFAAILSSFAIFVLLNQLTGSKMGIQSLGNATLTNLNHIHILLLMLVGILLAYFYFITNKYVKMIFNKLGDSFILKGIIGGLLLGIIGTILPLAMFSGEHQIDIVMANGMEIGVVVLIVTAVMKIFLTNICIESGLKGGHFFPLIFSGIAMGYAMSILLNTNVIIAASIVTTALLSNILKKPIAVVLLLLILFPANLIPLMLLTAAVSCLFKTPEGLAVE
ncbi:MAG: hypothetical protein BZ137_04320 [Methanosphaera sp. rholeuAM130]|nr:MAG: hypothetical protein BZ137_04320 [Methanosphaera sp. rholeuAM130]